MFKSKVKISSTMEGKFISIKPLEVGSIGHIFFIKNGRATRVESVYNSSQHSPLPLNSAAEISEINNLIAVLQKLVELCKEDKDKME